MEMAKEIKITKDEVDSHTITIPEGYEIDEENSTFKCIKLKKIENKLPDTWEEFCDTHVLKENESWIDECSIIRTIGNAGNNYINTERYPKTSRNVLPDKKTAEAVLALCQLIQLRDCYNDGWNPDWNDEHDKFCIHIYSNRIEVMNYSHINHVLTFKNENLRDKFVDNFRDLIEIAKPLL